MKHFYTHLIDIQSVTIELDKLEMKGQHKKELAGLIDHMIHQSVMDVVMSNLSQQDQHQFVTKLKSDNPKQVMEFLKLRIADIEDQIHKALEELKKELHRDINESHRMVSKGK